MGQRPKLIRSLDHAQLTVGQQHLRADDPAIRDPAQELAVFREPAPGRREPTALRLIETAKANGREPYRYLREFLENLPLARTRADCLALLVRCCAAAVTAIDTWIRHPLTT